MHFPFAELIQRKGYDWGPLTVHGNPTRELDPGYPEAKGKNSWENTMFADNYFLTEKVGLLVIELDQHLLLPVIMNLQHMGRCTHFALTCCNDWKINFEIQRPATDSFLTMSEVVIPNCLKKYLLNSGLLIHVFMFTEILLFTVSLCILPKLFCSCSLKLCFYVFN